MSSAALKAAATGNSPVASFSGFLDKLKPQLALALPRHMNADRMARLVLTEFSKNETLQKCDAKSIAGAVVMGAQMGLEIGVNGQAFLVPYFDKRRNVHIATFIPGWKGLVDLVNRSGNAAVWTGAVFHGDVFDYQLGDAPFVRHRPGEEDDPAKLTHVYAVGRVNGSQWPVIEVWTVGKVVKHRNKYNKVGDRHYSYRDWEMYARKIPLLQVLKYMPSSVELSRAIQVSEAADSGAYTIDGDFVTSIDPDSGEINPPPNEAPEPPPPPAAGDASSSATPTFDYAAATKKVKAAKDRDALDLMADDFRGLPDGDAKEALMAAYHTRVAELDG